MKYILKESQYRKIIETARIQPWKGRKGQIDLPDEAFGKALDMDREFNDKYGLKGDSKIDTLKKFRHPNDNGNTEIRNIQQNITHDLQDRYMKDNNTNLPVIQSDKIGGIANKRLAMMLRKNGMEVELKGKLFSYGNSKVPENTLIINLTSAFNCPSKENGECAWGKRCYAHQSEIMYHNTEYRNLRNQHVLGMLSTKELLKLLEAYIENAPLRIKFIRLHEDGDFKDQATVDFCDKIAGHLKAKYGIQTTAYTHRVLDYSGIKNITINASSYRIKDCDRYFIPVSPQDYAKVPDGLDLSGKDIPMVSSETGKKVDTTHGTYKCPCDCRKCWFCYRTKEQNGEPEGNKITIIETVR